MGKREREKGARFERWVAAKLGTQRVSTQGRTDQEHADVRHDHYYIQCKSYKRIHILRWFEETEEKARKVNKIPLLFLKEDYSTPVVVMSVETFLKWEEERHGSV